MKEIPEGSYCYRVIKWDNKNRKLITKVCPYWDKDRKRPDQLVVIVNF